MTSDGIGGITDDILREALHMSWGETKKCNKDVILDFYYELLACIEHDCADQLLNNDPADDDILIDERIMSYNYELLLNSTIQMTIHVLSFIYLCNFVTICSDEYNPSS